MDLITTHINADFDALGSLDLSKKMTALLPKPIIGLLKKIGTLANREEMAAFVVGGLVRDLELGMKNLDLDIVVEGDAISLGRMLAHELKASIVVHKRFGTCSVVMKDGLKIDLATARREVYEKPAALPTVEFSSLKDDLIRRDFTINAMAVSLNHSTFGQLVDFFGGQKDLERGTIKAMHDASFIDDPTRIFRAVRFEQRFGFSIDAHTEGLIRNAIKIEMFDRVQPQRIRDEVILILKERYPLKALKRMAELDELRFLHPKIALDSRLERLYKSISETVSWYDRSYLRKRAIDIWLVYLMALFDRLKYNDVRAICDRFVFRRGETMRILSYKRCAEKVRSALGSKSRVRPSVIYTLLEPLSFEVILLMMAGSDKAMIKARIREFFRKYNGMKISLKGEDIKRMGLGPCPDFKNILKKVLYAKLDGKVKNKSEEARYAKKLIKAICR